jgi:hypothetical protein
MRAISGLVAGTARSYGGTCATAGVMRVCGIRRIRCRRFYVARQPPERLSG